MIEPKDSLVPIPAVREAAIEPPEFERRLMEADELGMARMDFRRQSQAKGEASNSDHKSISQLKSTNTWVIRPKFRGIQNCRDLCQK